MGVTNCRCGGDGGCLWPIAVHVHRLWWWSSHCGNMRTCRCGLFNINSARKMLCAEGALRKLIRALVIERKKIRIDVVKGSEE